MRTNLPLLFLVLFGLGALLFLVGFDSDSTPAPASDGDRTAGLEPAARAAAPRLQTARSAEAGAVADPNRGALDVTRVPGAPVRVRGRVSASKEAVDGARDVVLTLEKKREDAKEDEDR